MRPLATSLLVVALSCWGGPDAFAQPLLPAPVYLGVSGSPEWDTFAGRTPAGTAFEHTFEGRTNTREHTLLLRQVDVKETWAITLNDRSLGTLVRNEADLVHAVAIPPETMRHGANILRITSKLRDDIVLERIELIDTPLTEAIDRARLHVTVVGDDGQPVPARVTIVEGDGALAALQPVAGSRQAVRPGVAYTGGDRVQVGLRPGIYRVRATRGPEYDAPEQTVTVAAGHTTNVRLALARVVPTPGWVAMDTHVHTRELSGHGDATVAERVLTLAGEGVELAVATEHDRPADYARAADDAGVATRLTTIVGSEVTTRTGHFNVFPADAPAVQVLNHPHDAHGGFVPFARPHFNVVTGASSGLARPFTAMEVVNSGAMRSDWMQPVRSWLALLNRGARITPVGASDSHDVSRFIVDQGRTYVRVDDARPGAIPVGAALDAIREGRTVVSLGLFVEAHVGEAGPGDMARASGPVTIEARVLGPGWMEADRVALWVNGEETDVVAIDAAAAAGVEKASPRWTLPARRHDYQVVVIASGPGVTDPSWAIPKPYQPTTPAWRPIVFGITNAIRVDADGDGVFSSARDYATRLVETHADVRELFGALAAHDAIVAAHAAELLEARGVDPSGHEVRAALVSAPPAVRDGVIRYLAAR